MFVASLCERRCEWLAFGGGGFASFQRHPPSPFGTTGDRQAVILLRQGYEGQVDTPLQGFHGLWKNRNRRHLPRGAGVSPAAYDEEFENPMKTLITLA
jgi:hypothetical protein